MPTVHKYQKIDKAQFIRPRYFTEQVSLDLFVHFTQQLFLVFFASFSYFCTFEIFCIANMFRVVLTEEDWKIFSLLMMLTSAFKSVSINQDYLNIKLKKSFD